MSALDTAIERAVADLHDASNAVEGVRLLADQAANDSDLDVHEVVLFMAKSASGLITAAIEGLQAGQLAERRS